MIIRLSTFIDLVIEGDTLNYQSMFQNISFDELISHQKGFVFAFILYILRSIGLNFKVALFLIVFVVDFLLLKVSNKLTKGIVIYFVTYFFLQWNYAFLSTSTYLIRQSLALAFALYGYFIVQKKYLSYVFLLLAIWVHPISVIVLFAKLSKQLKLGVFVILSGLFLYAVPILIEEIQIPVDLVEVNEMHLLVSNIVLIASVASIVLRQNNALALLLYSFAIFLLAFKSIDLIYYRIVLASYFAVIPIVSILIFNGLRHIFIKL